VLSLVVCAVLVCWDKRQRWVNEKRGSGMMASQVTQTTHTRAAAEIDLVMRRGVGGEAVAGLASVVCAVSVRTSPTPAPAKSFHGLRVLLNNNKKSCGKRQMAGVGADVDAVMRSTGMHCGCLARFAPCPDTPELSCRTLQAHQAYQVTSSQSRYFVD